MTETKEAEAGCSPIEHPSLAESPVFIHSEQSPLEKRLDEYMRTRDIVASEIRGVADYKTTIRSGFDLLSFDEISSETRQLFDDVIDGTDFVEEAEAETESKDETVDAEADTSSVAIESTGKSELTAISVLPTADEKFQRLVYSRLILEMRFNLRDELNFMQTLGAVPHSASRWQALFGANPRHSQVSKHLWMLVQNQTVHIIDEVHWHYGLPAPKSKKKKKTTAESSAESAVETVDTTTTKKKSGAKALFSKMFGGTGDSGEPPILDLLQIAYCYQKPIPRKSLPAVVASKTLIAAGAAPMEFVIATVNSDCFLAALHLRKCGFQKVAVLNLANGTAPAAAAHAGSEGGTQEENLFKRSTLYLSLWPHRDPKIIHKPYARYTETSGEQRDGFYPLHASHGVIYTPNAYVFRGSEHSGYALLPLKQRCVVSVITAQAPVCYSVSQFDKKYAPIFEAKIRNIYKSAMANGCDALVLGAMGCGIFNNPPAKVAQIFLDVLMEGSFRFWFKRVVFAILWDHNSQPRLVQEFAARFPEENSEAAFTSLDGSVQSLPPNGTGKPKALTDLEELIASPDFDPSAYMM